jgi:hypothetical protein
MVDLVSILAAAVIIILFLVIVGMIIRWGFRIIWSTRQRDRRYHHTWRGQPHWHWSADKLDHGGHQRLSRDPRGLGDRRALRNRHDNLRSLTELYASPPFPTTASRLEL